MDLIAEYSEESDTEQKIDEVFDFKNVNNLITDVDKIDLQSSKALETEEKPTEATPDDLNMQQKVGYCFDDSSDSDSSSDDSFVLSIQKLTANSKKTNDESSSESSSDDNDGETKTKSNKKLSYPKTKGETAPDELPEPEFEAFQLDLKQPITSMGLIYSVVNNIIVVKARKNAIALDEETILFNNQRYSIGKIFETFGPVSEPYYSIRVKSSEMDKFKVNDEVFYAPEAINYTKYIFDVEKLKAQKGSDASWLNDNEPPVEFLDYSDDEVEQAMKSKIKKDRNPNKNAKIIEDFASSQSQIKKSQSMNNNFGQKRRFPQSKSSQNVTLTQPQPLMNQNLRTHQPFMFPIANIPYQHQFTHQSQYTPQFYFNPSLQTPFENNSLPLQQQTQQTLNNGSIAFDNRFVQNQNYKKSF